MSIESKAPGQFIYEVFVNGVLYRDTPPLDVSLTQAFGEHDMMVARIEYPRLHTQPSSIAKWPVNAPVQVIWGRKPDNIGIWYGYVNHYEDVNPSDSESGTYQTTYYLIGTSKPMNTDTSKNWGSVTPTYIAKSIAQKYGLRAVLTSTDWLLPNETQANESDFMFMNRLAAKTGFRFWVSGGTLYFIDPAVVLLTSRSTNMIPIFRMDKTTWERDTIRRFRILLGDNLPGGVVTQRSLFGLTDAGQVINPKTSSTASISTVKTSRHVSSFAEGQNIINAWQSLSQFWIGAQAELYGNKLVYPGKLIDVQGQWANNDTAGYWLIAKAQHALKSAYTADTTQDWYVTRVEMLRNTTGSLPNLKGLDLVKPEFVNCQLIHNSWRAQVASVIYDGRVS